MEKELQKCLMCKKPFCTTCPAGTEVRNAIEMVKNGQATEAGEMLFNNNPLTAITGAVCPNHLYCHGSCILSKKGNAVDFGQIERVVSKQHLESLVEKEDAFEIPTLENPKKFFIVGAGPAGLALAFYLRKQGHKITIHEKENKTGGMLRYGIPDFRLDKSLIDMLTTVLTNMGIEIKTDSEIDLNVLKDENNEIIKNHDAVIIAVGACVSKKLGIEGEDLPIVTHAVEYLKNPNKAENVVVVGGGNVAIDCALTAAHLSDGNGTVTLCYRRTLEDMKAYPEELELAESMKVKFEFRMTPKQILGKGAMFTRDEEEVIMMADTVVIAIGQTATTEGLVKAENFETETPKVYALGDAVTGTNTIIKAVAQAKELAAKLLD